jgi:hypothetical protein
LLVNVSRRGKKLCTDWKMCTPAIPTSSELLGNLLVNKLHRYWNNRSIPMQKSAHHDTWGLVNLRMEITLDNMTLQFIYTTFRLHGKDSETVSLQLLQ